MESEDDAIFAKSNFLPVELPKDDEGFVQSFDASDEENLLKFYKTYGFVCVSNVLSPDDINGSVNEIWDILEKDHENFDRNDASTWGPGCYRHNALGMVGDAPALGHYAWKNRQNESLYKVFSLLYGTKELWVSLDRWGFMRPTVGVPNGSLAPVQYRTTVEKDEALDEGKGFHLDRDREIRYKDLELQRNIKRLNLPADEAAAKLKADLKEFTDEYDAKKGPWAPQRIDHPEWKTKSSWLHWDLNPWAWVEGLGVDYRFDHFIIENNGSKNEGWGKLQGLICLVDSREEDGGFLCVPGFTQYLHQFVEETKHTQYARRAVEGKNYSFVNLPASSCLNNYAQKITARAGTLIAWSSELLHCNYPNASSRFRLNQYVKMFPAQEGRIGVNQREKVVREVLEQQKFRVSAVGKKVFGLESYRPENSDEAEASGEFPLAFLRSTLMFGVPLLIAVLGAIYKTAT